MYQRVISAAQFDREAAEKREAGAATPETETPAYSVHGAPIFDHREHTGDLDIDRSYSITSQRPLIAPPTDLESDIGHAFNAISLIR
jgi:hypothetical protein